MRRARACWLLAAALVAAPIAAVRAGVTAGASRAASPGLIVFASDRAGANPGEIYSLAPGTAPRDVSRSLAGDYGLAVAPAGDQIAFWSGRSGRDRVYLARSDGTGLRLVRNAGPGLAGGSGRGSPPTFSADGSKLFVGYDTFASSGHSTPFTFVVDTRAAAARPIRPCEGVPAPSPDGTLVACAFQGSVVVSGTDGRVRFRLGGWQVLWSSLGRLAVAQTDPATSTPATSRGLILDEGGRTLAHVAGTPVEWSPDGRQLAYLRGSAVWVGDPFRPGHARLLPSPWDGGPSFTPDSRYVATSDKGKPVLVPVGGGREIPGGNGGGPGAWSPQGRLAFVGFPEHVPIRAGYEASVYVTDTHGLHPRVVGRFPYDDHAYSELAWRPDGKRVLFLTSNDCGTTGLYTVSTLGGPTRPLTHDPRQFEDPAWSPDGSRIAYSVEQFGCHIGAGEPIVVETRAADGSAIQHVTSDGGGGSFDTDPAYSPDGGRIAYLHGTFSTENLQVIDLGGATPVDLPQTSGAPAWSPDGSKIAYVSGRSLMAIPPGGGTAEVLAKRLPAQSCGTGLAWSPDGTQLALGGTSSGIYLITLGTPATVRLAVSVKCAENPSFSPDGAALAFDAPVAHPLGAQTAIMAAGIDGAGIRTLSTVPFRQSVHPSWQPLR